LSRSLSTITDVLAQAKIRRYLECLRRWSSKINLTGAENEDAAFDTLIAPVLGAEGMVFGPVIDVGSGNGSPGLILAALRPEIGFTLLEPRAKRWAFLREAARAAEISNVEVLRSRDDQYRGPRAKTVTIRAVGLQPQDLRPLLLPDGCVLVFGGPVLPACESTMLPNGARVQRQCFT
jgi:16S rRNA (guanine527-N7)-methyltransferase